MNKIKNSLLKITFAFVILLVLSLNAKITFAKDEGYTIEDYTVHAVYNDDNTVDVVETITVYFNEPRHGIYRDLNTEMSLLKGDISKKYIMDIKKIRVNDTFETADETGYLDIKIGSPDVTITGEKTYVVSYKYFFPDDRMSDQDFIFYSVLGDKWTTTVKKFSFTVDFTKSLDGNLLDDIRIYSGVYGRTDNFLNVQYKVTKDSISGSAENIAPENAISIYANLKEGYFHTKKLSKTINYILTGLAILFSVIGLTSAILHRKRKIEPVSCYNPPEGITSADAGYIMDLASDNVDIASLYLYWASKGYVSIEQRKHCIIVHKTANLPDSAQTYELSFFNTLFAHQNELCIEDCANDTIYGKLFIQAKNNLTNRWRFGLLTKNKTAISFMWVGVFFTMFSLIFSSSVSRAYNVFYGVFTGIAFIFMYLRSSRKVGKVIKGKANLVFNIIFYLLYIFLVALFASFGTDQDIQLPVLIYWLPVIISVANGFAIYLTVDFDVSYKPIVAQLMGLRDFIKSSKKENLMNIIGSNTSYYFELLPYAMVFGLAKEWEAAFSEITLEPPYWYYGYEPMYFNSYYFYDNINRGIETPISHSVSHTISSESSSSSGGGGFSGGGGGGGGGGSW